VRWSFAEARLTLANQQALTGLPTPSSPAGQSAGVDAVDLNDPFSANGGLILTITAIDDHAVDPGWPAGHDQAQYHS
jgi:hypothetical protein